MYSAVPRQRVNFEIAQYLQQIIRKSVHNGLIQTHYLIHRNK